MFKSITRKQSLSTPNRVVEHRGPAVFLVDNRVTSKHQHNTSAITQPVIQLNKDKTANMVRQARELTQDIDSSQFAITGSLALQMWHWALNPEAPLPREPGDIDLLIASRENSIPIGRRIVDEREGPLPQPLKEPMIRSYPGKFFANSMHEDKFRGTKLDLKIAGETSRWGEIKSVLMPIIDMDHRYHLPIQTPKALLQGLKKKLAGLGDDVAEQNKVKQDIKVAKAAIKQFKAFQTR